LAPNAEQLASQQQTTTREERSQWSIAEQNESKSKLSTLLSQFTGENQLQTGCNIAISEKMKPTTISGTTNMYVCQGTHEQMHA
jgi:hypothetical protein